MLLPNGWSISPAGKQVPLSTLPMSLLISPDGKYALVLHGGFLPPSISVIDIAAAKETSRVPVDDAWLGLTFNKAGDKVYVGGGASAKVFEFNYKDGQLSAARSFAVIPAGKDQATDFIGDVTLSADGRFLYAANLFRDSVSVLNAQTGVVVNEFKTGRRPYRLLLNADGATLLVSHWAEASVGLYNLAEGRLIEVC
jgi:YVTN family beta-propeller protein